MGLILAIIGMLLFGFFAWINGGETVTFHLIPNGVPLIEGQDGQYPVWGIILGSALVTAVFAWIIGVRGHVALRRRMNERELELRDARDRVKRLENSLQEYEGRIHDFTLKVLDLARSAQSPGQLEANVGEVKPPAQALTEGTES